MKNSIKFLNAISICLTLFLVSSCTTEIEGTAEYPIVPDSKIKSISFDADWGSESWVYTYDSEGRVTTIANSWEGGEPEIITFDYSAENLVITKGNNSTYYKLDDKGRISRELWNDEGTEYAGFEYNSEGFLIKIIEHYDGEDHLKYENKITKNNITNRIRYEDDGTTIREDRVFDYTIGDNSSSIHQIYAVDSEWKVISGLYGKQSKKLVKNYVRKLASDPDSNYGASYEYTFDDENRVATQTKNGTGSGGNFSESWSYTYYED
ncbi:DUF4595 domain-containing protein [Gelidibacter japonicus]|uniref:DUF4595 domain-containing protein n=1 Tax=Gelidibacter japonicus TaxID=1962232 RepID=UPI0013D89DE2|nr:DUF4595 domain-containing protein [Gelidibacter japonicus]